MDFRTQQCHAFNNKNFGLTDIAEDVVWVPKYTGSEWKRDSIVFRGFSMVLVWFLVFVIGLVCF